MNIQVLDEKNILGTKFHMAQQYIEYCSQLFDSPEITWSTAKGELLAVTNIDLRERLTIDWHDVNLIFAETCQQIYDYSFKLNPAKAYVFITESAADFKDLQEKFFGISIVKHFTIFNEVIDYGKELFVMQSHLATIEPARHEPEFDFFCLVGRKSTLRSRFVSRLSQLDLSKSLVKYHGEVVPGSGAPFGYDQFDYASKNFYRDYYMVTSGMTLLSKIVQPKLYDNFRFEVQYETDSLESHGWSIKEYHVTEKTIKPLIMNKPCLMYGPWQYHQWLASYGVDLGQGNFDHAQFDNIQDDAKRADAIIHYLSSIKDYKEIVPNQSCFEKNIFGLYRLSCWTRENVRDFYSFLKNS